MSYIYNLTDTWNDAGTTFTSIKMNVADTASNAASLLIDLQTNTGGAPTSRFNVTKAGRVNATEVNLTNAYVASLLQFVTASGRLDINGDTFLSRRGAANFRLGNADAAAPVAQTLSVQSVVAGTSNTAGANFTITGSQGTGTGAGGSLLFQVAPAGSTGTAQNALSTALTIDSTRAATFAAAIYASSFQVAGGVGAATYNAGLGLGSSSAVSFSTGAGALGPFDVALTRVAANIIKITDASTGGGAVELQEMTAPAAPAANGVRIYAVDNGAGKTQLMALFASGAAQQIAIEP